MKIRIVSHKAFPALMVAWVCVAGQARGYESMDPTNTFSWSTASGWLNFGSTNFGGVMVTNDHLVGTVWAENIGWICLGVSNATKPYGNDAAGNYGVNMDSSGRLSGYAWSKNVGWIAFSNSHGQVSIDVNTGCFSGYAWGENIGWIHFANASPEYLVQTLWTHDTTPPSATLAFSQPFYMANQSGVATVTLSEAVSGFDTSDVSVTGGAKGSFSQIDSTHYQVMVTAGALDGLLTMTIPAGAFADLKGNLLAAQVQSMATVDATAPMVSIVLSPNLYWANQSGMATITVSEVVSSFDASDVTVSGGTKGTFSQIDATHYVVVVTAGAVDGALTVTISAGALIDLAGNQLMVQVQMPATTPIGNIDPVKNFAWATDAGWINLAPAGGGVTVVSKPAGYLTGYAWAENVGWIKLGSGSGPYLNNSSLNWGVNLNPDGKLSGYAWCKNVGWIAFSNSFGQVSVDHNTGSFDGYAWGENFGWIHFRGVDVSPIYGVRTTVFGCLGAVFSIR